MSKNWKFGNIGNDVTLAMAVSAGAAGDVVPVGSGGLAGYLVTDIATSEGPNAPGLATGEASVRLLPAQGVVELEVAGSAGDPVFTSVGGEGIEYATTNSETSVHIGHIVEPAGHTPKSGHAFVFLGSAYGIAAAEEGGE